METKITQTWQGYGIEIGKGPNRLTVSHIRKGVATCYLYGFKTKYYKSKAAAEKIARQIEAGEIKIK